MSKKGSIFDLFLYMAFAFAIVVVFGLLIYTQNKTYTVLLDKAPILQEGLYPGDNATAIIQGTVGKVSIAYESLNWISTMLIIGMFFSIIATSFLVRTEPAWFIAYIFVVCIAVILSVPISNAYETVYTNPLLAASFSGFYGTTWIFANLPVWITCIGLLSSVLIFVNIIRNDQY